MVTASQAADAWMTAHSLIEWRALLNKYEALPVLPEQVIVWLRYELPAFSDTWRTFSDGPELKPTKALARFEESFIATVLRALVANA